MTVKKTTTRSIGLEETNMRIPAMKVNQWLPEWDHYRFRSEHRQSKPDSYFYLASISVSILRRLSNVPRRGDASETGRQQAHGLRVEDIGIQRGFEEERAEDIRRFVEAGYPWATLRRAERDRFTELKKPGWLPTALVLNIVKPTTRRKDINPNPNDLIQVEANDSNMAVLILPSNAEDPSWRPEGQIHPLEVIDGQHRLLAFEERESLDSSFELPVVLFHDLDISWQAYLFWTINITPKRIGPSLAFDLYPLLRTEDWLEPVAGPLAYRETRAQELTEALWSNPESPWYERIGMLGRERGKVTQAAFVRSLTLSFIRRSDPGGSRPGGLYGAPLSNQGRDVLEWSRAQQAAYLMFLWSELEGAIKQTSAPWAKYVRETTNKEKTDLTGGRDAAFSGAYSLLATDQGVRGFFQVSNDLSFDLCESLDLTKWVRDRQSEATESGEVAAAMRELGSIDKIATFVRMLCENVAQFDWSSAVTPGLPEETSNRQSRYRAGSGYREVRRQLLLHLSQTSAIPIKESASRIVEALGYDE